MAADARREDLATKADLAELKTDIANGASFAMAVLTALFATIVRLSETTGSHDRVGRPEKACAVLLLPSSLLHSASEALGIQLSREGTQGRLVLPEAEDEHLLPRSDR